MTRTILIATTLGWALAAAAVAQQATASLEQLERKYRGMSYIHIEKCDRDGDGRYTKSEQLCVSSIYQAMYLDRD